MNVEEDPRALELVAQLQAEKDPAKLMQLIEALDLLLAELQQSVPKPDSKGRFL
jgi:hypothetical protein